MSDSSPLSLLPLKLPPRADVRPWRPLSEAIVLSLAVAAITTITIFLNTAITEAHASKHPVRFDDILMQLDELRERVNGPMVMGDNRGMEMGKRLVFYNRPPKTGSTSVRVAMKKALEKEGKVSAHCFNMIEWNEMGIRTIINRRDVDFYGCHTRLEEERYKEVKEMRQGNVVFMTSTRDASKLILSAYLQDKRDRDFTKITGQKEIEGEVKKFKEWAKSFPIDFLYKFHGGKQVFDSCPYEWRHVFEMRDLASRYEIVVDLEKAEESASMTEAVLGIRPDFGDKYNERSTNTSACIQALMKVDTSERSCGNELVHHVLRQQFNIIKDRLMQNRCFEEGDGSWWPCDQVQLTMDGVQERERGDSQEEGRRLRKMGWDGEDDDDD